MNHYAVIAGSLTPDEFQAIGEFVVAWSTFEHCLRAEFLRLTGLKTDASAIISSRLTSRTQRELVFDLLRDRWGNDAEKKKILKAWDTKIQKLEGLRNTVIHSLWWGTAEWGDAAVRTPEAEKPQRGKSAPSVVQFSATCLRELKQETEHMTAEFTSFLDQLAAASPLSSP